MAQEKILFADDNPAVTKLVETYLRMNNYEVYTAIDGQKAYDLANEINPDLIISDVMMPHISGFDLCRKLRENALTWHIPVMLLSAKDQTTDKVQGLEEGADDYMTKPFNLDELMARTKVLLKRSKEALDANPSTRLPGNISIEKEIVRRIKSNELFAVCYCDLDNFKAFNDYYGFYIGDRAIKFTGQVIKDVVRDFGKSNDFVGHIGGDDFIFITVPEIMDKLCQEIMIRFDTGIKEMYQEEDLKRGYIVSKNRQGITTEFPIMSISIVVITNRNHKIEHPGQISMLEGELKKHVKRLEGSNYVVDKISAEFDHVKTFEEIIIAHHDWDFKVFLKKAFSKYPFNLILAKNGAETILLVSENEPALLIIDPSIELINGETILKILRENEKYAMLPILFFAKKDNFEHLKQLSSELGINGIIREDTSPHEIANYIAQILDINLNFKKEED